MKWFFAILAALAFGLMITLKPGLIAGIMATLLIAVSTVFLIIWLRRKTEKKLDQKTSKWSVSIAGVITVIVLIVIGMVAYNLISGYMHPKAPQTRVVAEIPKCAGDYDFSRLELVNGEVKEVIIPFRPDCRTEVSLPPCANYRTRPTTDYEIRFIDGAKFIGGPGKQTWFGVHRGLFAVQGLTQAGTLEIFLEKK